ncbi:MAG: hypothetical protein ACMG6E_05365 [Candidatus Roizmanbacteria bacterium]
MSNEEFYTPLGILILEKTKADVGFRDKFKRITDRLLAPQSEREFQWRLGQCAKQLALLDGQRFTGDNERDFQTKLMYQGVFVDMIYGLVPLHIEFGAILPAEGLVDDMEDYRISLNTELLEELTQCTDPTKKGRLREHICRIFCRRIIGYSGDFKDDRGRYLLASMREALLVKELKFRRHFGGRDGMTL